MQFATIVPTAYLDLIKEKNYHMALAHLIGKDRVYTEFYEKQASRGAFVIMDNGIIEGEPQPIDKLCKRATAIGAQEIVLPDAYRDMEKTLQQTSDAMDYMLLNRIDLKVMAVAQGATFEEWCQCAVELLHMGIDTLGIPKVLTTMAGRDGRAEGIKYLYEEYPRLTKNVQFHLLGCWDTPLECKTISKLVQQGDLPEIRGCDSAIAYVYARDGLRVCDGPRPSGAIDFGAKDADVKILQENIEIWETSGNVQKDKITKLF